MRGREKKYDDEHGTLIIENHRRGEDVEDAKRWNKYDTCINKRGSTKGRIHEIRAGKDERGS